MKKKKKNHLGVCACLMSRSPHWAYFQLVVREFRVNIERGGARFNASKARAKEKDEDAQEGTNGGKSLWQKGFQAMNAIVAFYHKFNRLKLYFSVFFSWDFILSSTFFSFQTFFPLRNFSLQYSLLLKLFFSTNLSPCQTSHLIRFFLYSDFSSL